MHDLTTIRPCCYCGRAIAVARHSGLLPVCRKCRPGSHWAAAWKRVLAAAGRLLGILLVMGMIVALYWLFCAAHGIGY